MDEKQVNSVSHVKNKARRAGVLFVALLANTLV